MAPLPPATTLLPLKLNEMSKTNSFEFSTVSVFFSLQIFDRIGIEKLRKKSLILTGMLFDLLVAFALVLQFMA